MIDVDPLILSAMQGLNQWVQGEVLYFKHRMGDPVEGTHEMLCIFFDNGTAGKHRCVCAGFLFSDRECMFRSFHASYSACCLRVPLKCLWETT